jgi:hypothetical protein
MTNELSNVLVYENDVNVITTNEALEAILDFAHSSV